jgi:hypothetical protein
MQLTTSESYLNHPIAVSSDPKPHLMIVACLLTVAVVFILLTRGCEFDGGRPADAYFMSQSSH